MLFNSISYLLFFPIVFLLYWSCCSKNVKIQNLFLFFASYFFYGWWDWRFLSLIILCSLVNFSGGVLLGKTKNPKYRKLIIVICCVISLGVLGIFKYYNFFISSFVDLLHLMNIHIQVTILHLILPVGISFYTFHTLTYTIEVYKRKFEPTKDIVAFALFVSIFPLAMAGPIERATNLLPQLYKKRTLDYKEIVEGLQLVLWGFFMKIVVADRLSIYVDSVYNNVENHFGITLLLATVFFSFQIYCDFAGYSNIALGCGKLLGFKFINNFHRPYFAVNVTDFWKRWHISLSTWFRDYLYIPLGGNRCSTVRHYVNLMITFLVSGFWHGANWTFIVWGGLNGFFQIIGKIFTPFKNLSFNLYPLSVGKMKKVFDIVVTFGLITFTWIFFRASNVSEAFQIISKIFTNPGTLFIDVTTMSYGLFAIVILIIKEVKDEFFANKFLFMNNAKITIRWATYMFLIVIILTCGVFDGGQFIYFQF